MSFVELGCGTAEPTLRVLESFPNCEGVCLDSEPEMLAIAKQKLRPYRDRGDVVEGDMVRCEFRKCDLIFSAKAFHHMAPHDLPNLLNRIAAKLRRNGSFILFDAMSVGPTWGKRMRKLASSGGCMQIRY